MFTSVYTKHRLLLTQFADIPNEQELYQLNVKTSARIRETKEFIASEEASLQKAQAEETALTSLSLANPEIRKSNSPRLRELRAQSSSKRQHIEKLKRTLETLEQSLITTEKLSAIFFKGDVECASVSRTRSPQSYMGEDDRYL